MEILILCGVFALENEREVVKHARRAVEFSANTFQKKLMKGFRQNGYNSRVLSAPFIGSYPNASDIRVFSGFHNSQSEVEYVSFHNLWGWRNFSRANALKRAMKHFIASEETEKLILVYSPHTPFLQAAAYAKTKDPNIKICLFLPDLPHYMNLDAKISFLYRLGKWFDIRAFHRLNRTVDSYVLLTEAMKDKIQIADKPYLVTEGIVDHEIFEEKEKAKRLFRKKENGEKIVVYTGKMNERFGVKKLVDAFCNIEDPSYRLVLCGEGDADEYIQQKSKIDSRILATGQITPEEADEWMLRADVLVNPRENGEEYTKYSFPSKTIAYLATGNPTVGYMLDGMPKIYREFIWNAEEDGLSHAIVRAIQADESEKTEKYRKMRAYMKQRSGKELAKKIVQMNQM